MCTEPAIAGFLLSVNRKNIKNQALYGRYFLCVVG